VAVERTAVAIPRKRSAQEGSIIEDCKRHYDVNYYYYYYYNKVKAGIFSGRGRNGGGGGIITIDTIIFDVVLR